MLNFRINDGTEQPEPHVPNEFVVGTKLTFQTIGGQLKSAIHIPVVFA